MTELRAELLQRVHDDLDDDHARSVYADYLLACAGSDAWHGELIRLQLDGGDPARIAAILAERQLRALGPLYRLFDVTWRRGFPERAATTKWTAEYVPRLLESRHLATLRSIEIGYLPPPMIPELLAAPPAVTTRITRLVLVEQPTREDLAPLFASEAFPALRELGLRARARAWPHGDPEINAALLASALARRVERLAIWSPAGQRARWLPLVPPSVAQLDVFELETARYTEQPTSYVRGPDGVLAEADPIVAVAAYMTLYQTDDIAHLVDGWSSERLGALEQHLSAAGHLARAEAVRDQREGTYYEED